MFTESTQTNALGSPTRVNTLLEADTGRMWPGAKVLCGFTTGADCAWTVQIQLCAVCVERSLPLYVHEAENVP